MRVLMVGPYPKSPRLLDGGVAAAMTYLCEALVATKSIELVGVRIGKDPAHGSLQEFPWPMAELSLGRGSLITLYRRQKVRFSELIHQHQPDVVHAQGTDLSGLLAVGSGLPNVVTAHGLLWECAKFHTQLVPRIRAQLTALLTERSTIKRARSVIAISPYVRRYYGAAITGASHDIPNAVSSAYFDLERRPQKGRHLYAGRIANGKGLVELLQAVSIASAHIEHLVLAGATTDVTYERMLRGLAAELGIQGKVTFAGLLDEPALMHEFMSAEALVLPSHQETAPMVVQQAMAAGLTVVATTVGGIPDQIDHDRTGLLFGAGDVEGLAKLLTRIATEPALTESLGSSARMVATRHYRASVIAEKTLSVYHAVLGLGQFAGAVA